MIRIALLGDFDPAVTAHRAIPRALALAGDAAGLAVTPQWVHTSALTEPEVLSAADGVWCVPASPYANPSSVLAAIRAVREGGVPFLGTCGGFQHALLEAAQSLWGIADPQHAEDVPDAPEPVIAPLACSLVEVSGSVFFAPGSRLALAYGALEAEEQYHCRYGLHPRFAARLAAGPLRATGWDQAGEVRAVELDEHPFFVATLFQPERRALAGGISPLAAAFLQAVARGPVAQPRSVGYHPRVPSERSYAARCKRRSRGPSAMTDEVFLMCSACYEPCPAASAHVVPRWRADVGQVITAYRCAACFPASLVELRDALHADPVQLAFCDFLTRRGYGDAAALRDRSGGERLTILLAVVDAVQDGRLQLEP